MSEAIYRSPGEAIDYTPVAAKTGGEVVQLADGRAAFTPLDIAAGVQGAAQTRGIVTVAKTSGVVILDGAEVYWDHSANTATYTDLGNDKDFFIGVAVGDAASADTTMKVALNVMPQYIIDLAKSAFRHVPVLTAGTPLLRSVGGGVLAAFSATAEAQKLDMLSERSFPVGSNWILEAVIRVVTNADADVGDLNVGVANGTHASDADSITESAFFHFDMGADLDLDAESDDGTTEVAATDTTVNWAVGTAIHLVIDGRDETDIQMYVNGALVLGATTFTLAAATGPLRALFHLEKSSNDSPGEVELQRLNVRIANE